MTALRRLSCLTLVAALLAGCSDGEPPRAPAIDVDEPLPPWPANDTARDHPSLALAAHGDVWLACSVFDGAGERLELSLLTAPDDSRRFVAEADQHVMGTALAADPDGGLRLVWSAFDGAAWRLRETSWAPAPEAGAVGEQGPVGVLLEGPDRRPIHPEMVAGPDGGLLLTWMEMGADGPSAWAMARGPDGWGAPLEVGPGGWFPTVAARGDGRFVLAYDAMVADSYDVLLVELAHDGAGGLTVERRRRITDSPRFEAHAAVAVAGERVYIAYEEGPEDWGREGSEKELGVALHTERRVRILALEDERLAPLDEPFMQQISTVLRTNCERPRLRVDGSGQLLLSFRGMPLPREVQDPSTLAMQNLQEERKGGGVGWRSSIWFTYFSVYDGTSWSYKGRHQAGEAGSQGRSDAPIAITPLARGGTAFAVVGDGRERDLAGETEAGDTVFADQVYWWKPICTNATDVAVGRIGKGAPVNALPLGDARPLPAWIDPAPMEPHLRGARSLPDGTPVVSALGDLHRHTNTSRCSSNWDGPFSDQVRYAYDVAGLDYLAVTDHFEHMTRYDWWRHLGAVEAYHAPGRMVQLFGYERADVFTGHRNVIARDRPPPLVGYRRKFHAGRDVARADTPAELWQHFRDHDVLTIPHTPAGMFAHFPAVFDWLAFEPRYDRLVEVWQGYRGGSEAEEAPRALQTTRPDWYARAALDGGLHFGFVAASDHQSTYGAFGGAWTTGLTRGEVYDALHARLTWGSTCPMLLWAAWDGVPLGVSARHAPGPTTGVDVEVEVAAPQALSLAELISDGRVVAEQPLVGRRATLHFDVPELEVPATGSRYVYVRIRTATGELGWSSPTRLSGDGSPGPDGPIGARGYDRRTGKAIEQGVPYTARWLGDER